MLVLKHFVIQQLEDGWYPVCDAYGAIGRIILLNTMYAARHITSGAEGLALIRDIHAPMELNLLYREEFVRYYGSGR